MPDLMLLAAVESPNFTTGNMLTFLGMLGTVIASHIRQEFTQERRAADNHAELVAQMTVASEKNFEAHAHRKEEIAEAKATAANALNETRETLRAESSELRERVTKAEAKIEAFS